MKTQMTSTNANAAIHFTPESYQTDGSKIMGMQSANAGFLRAYLRYSGHDRFYCYAESESQFASFRECVASSRSSQDASAEWIPAAQPERLREPGCLFRPGTLLSRVAWERRHSDEMAYSICGVTHTICDQQVMEAFGSYLIAPFHSWDALVCTSTAAKATIEHVLAEWSEYLFDRLSAKRPETLQLEIIPLGVDCDKFGNFGCNQTARTSLRTQLRIADDDVAFLYAGRLSFHDKAHPLPIYRALEQASRQTSRRLHLMMAGRAWNSAIEEEIIKGAKLYCPSVNVVFLNDSQQPDVWKKVWAAADVFTSLADNIQETFGLTPVEAMAAGLPVVVSDWDGYRDTVRDGVDGFRIPTSLPPAGTGIDVALRYAAGIDSYHRYIGHTSQCTAVDIDECCRAYVKLINNPEMRQKMGQSGQERARSTFDWPVIIRSYQELWRELAGRRMQQQVGSTADRAACPNPLAQDPFKLFAGFASRALHHETVLTLNDGIDTESLRKMYSSRFANYAQAVLASHEECRLVLLRLENGPSTIANLLDNFGSDRHAAVHRSLVWFLKTGLAKIVQP